VSAESGDEESVLLQRVRRLIVSWLLTKTVKI